LIKNTFKSRGFRLLNPKPERTLRFPRIAAYALQDATLHGHCVKGLLKISKVGGQKCQIRKSSEREEAAVGNVHIYKEVLSAHFDWLPYRGLLLQKHVKAQLSKDAQHRSTPDDRFFSPVAQPAFVFSLRSVISNL
jgi:hypothetical protein